MADDSVMCTQAEMLQKAGANVSTTLNAATDTTFVYSNAFIGQAESTINSMTRYNWSDAFVTPLNADVINILSETTSNLAAIYCIQFDMSGYTSRGEAESMITVLRDGFLRNISILKDKKVQTFVIDA